MSKWLRVADHASAYIIDGDDVKKLYAIKQCLYGGTAKTVNADQCQDMANTLDLILEKVESMPYEG